MAGTSRGIGPRQLDALAAGGTLGGLTDAQLLERFASRRGHAAELAFSALVERHGPMVFRTCRAILRDPHDAQDAFQATFLVLVRKAGSLWVRDSLGPWLHLVARRTASRARSAAWRARHERLTAAMASHTAGEGDRIELRQAILEELSRLPERYRSAVVPCLLEEMTTEQAAQRLGWPVGTVHSRLARGRRLLQSRLARRGFLPGSAGLALALAAEGRAAVPPRLVISTARGAMGVSNGRALVEGVSAGAVTLSERILRAMFISQLKWAACLSLTAGVAVAGLAMQSRGAPAADPVGEPSAARPTSEAPPSLRTPAGRGVPRPAAAPTTPGANDVNTNAPGDPNRPPSGPMATRQSDLNVPARIVAVSDGAGAKVWVIDPRTRAWHTYKALAGTKVSPYVRPQTADRRPGAARPVTARLGTTVGEEFIAVKVEGERIDEIAAYSAKSGAWVRQALHEPATGQAEPVVSDETFVLYSLGGHAYAFSAATGTWDSVDLKMASGARVERLAVPGMAIVKGSGPLHAYDAREGRFKDVESDEK